MSGKVNEDDATDVDNYEIRDEDDHEVEIDKAELEGNDVILTLKDKYKNEKSSEGDFEKQAVKNQTKIEVTVEKAVFNGDKDYKAEDVKMTDTTLPEVEDVKVVGSDTIKLKFSEPLIPQKVTREYNKDDEEWNVTGYFADKKAFEVKSGDDNKYYVKEVQLFKNNTEANVVLYSDLKIDKDTKKGKINIKVNGDIKDYAEFGLVTNAIESEFEKDEEKPYVTGFKDAKADEVTLIFNEDVRLTGNLDELEYQKDFYHTNTTNHVKQGGVSIDGNEVTLKFDSDHKLPDGISHVMIDGGALEDLWSNEVDAVRQDVERVEDKAKPEVTKVEQGDDEHHAKVKFSEKVQNDDEDNGAKNEDNYTLLDEDGKELKNKIKKITLNDDEDQATIEFKDDLDAGDYSLVIDNIADQSENENKLEKVTMDFKMDDKTDPNSDDDKFEAKLYNSDEDPRDFDNDLDDQKIIINFKEKMATEGKYSVADLDNYQIKLEDGPQFDLADYDDASISVINDGKSVEIHVPYDKDKDKNKDNDRYNKKNNHVNFKEGDKIIVSRVTDAAGNKTDKLVNEIKLKAPTDIKVKSAKATDVDKVEVEFDGEIDLNTDEIKLGFARNDIRELDNIAKSVHTKINDDKNTVLEITLNDKNELNYDANNGAVRVVIDDKAIESEDVNGLKLATNDYQSQNEDYTVEDKIAPALDQYDENAAEYAAKNYLGLKDTDKDDDPFDTAVKNLKGEDKVRVYFDDEDKAVKVDLTFAENIDKNSVSVSTFEFDDDDYEVKDYLVHEENETDSVNGNVITLTLDGYNVPDEDETLKQVAEFKDANGNKLEKGKIDAEIAIVDKGTVDNAKEAKDSKDKKDDAKEENEKDAKAILNSDDLKLVFAKGDDKDSVTKRITLSKPIDLNGCTIKWNSNKPAIIDNEGNVVRPDADAKNAEVTLTVTVTKGEAKVEKAFDVIVKKAELDTSSIDTAIENAKNAKENVKISEDGSDVAQEVKWVTKEVSDTLDAAIKAATEAKTTVKTQKEVTNVVNTLNTAVENYNNAKKPGTKVTD